MDLIPQILKEYGVLGVVVVVSAIIILKGQFTFTYPRKNNDNDD